MTMKEIAKKIIASINPGNADISGIGDGTIKGALVELNSKIAAGSGTFSAETNASGWYYATVNVGFKAKSFVVTMQMKSGSLPSKPIQVREIGNNYEVFVYGLDSTDYSLYAGAVFNWIAIK